MTDSETRVVETACHCAGSPHERDRFTLSADIPIGAGVAVLTALQEQGEHGNNAAALIEALLFNGGITDWNLVDDKGERLRITPDNVASRVTWRKGGAELAIAANQQWISGADLTPFGLGNSQRTSAASSPNGQTEDSTSPRTSSSRKRPVPSE